MASRDLHNNVHVKAAIAPVVITNANTAQVSAIIDTAGYESLEFVIAVGTITDADATVTALVEHSDAANFSGSEAVPDNQLLGTEALASLTFADDGEPRKIGYIGGKRYVRLTLTPAANDAGSIPIAALAILGHPRNRPTVNPPA